MENFYSWGLTMFFFFRIVYVISRETNLRNVEHVIGLVLYTGRETKIQQVIQAVAALWLIDWIGKFKRCKN